VLLRHYLERGLSKAEIAKGTGVRAADVQITGCHRAL